MKNLIEKQKKEKIVYQGKFFKFKCDEVVLPNQKTAVREYVSHPGAVGLLVIDKDKNVILEEQYRYPMHEVILEIPAGKLEIGEDIIIAAKRELEEETGLIAKDLIKLGEAYPCASYSDEIIYLFLVLDYENGKQHLDEDENLNVIKFPFDRVKEMIKNGIIKDSKTIQAIYLYELLYQK